MIYVKIYLDKNENGEDMLVFDSVKEDSGYRFSCACSRAQVNGDLDKILE